MKLTRQPGTSVSRLALAVALGGSLVACGGSGSGDTDNNGVDGIDNLNLGTGRPIDENDADNDGIRNIDDPDFVAMKSDLDGDGIPNLEDTDVDGDGVINTLDEDFVPNDADGDGFSDVTADKPCGTAPGSVADGSANDWSDNCEIKRTLVGGQFADSLYAVGVQRILYCTGFGTGDYLKFVDGEFGPNSETALKAYQTANSLTSDGTVGPQTWTSLRSKLEVLKAGVLGSEPDALGFSTGSCAGNTLFYQNTKLGDDGLSIDRLGFTLAKNPPNESDVVPFSIEKAFGKL